MVVRWRSSTCAFNLVNFLGDVMKLKLSKATREALENPRFEGYAVEAMEAEKALYDGIDWIDTLDLANEMCSIILGDGGEVEYDSPIDELMAGVLVFAYDQALKRAAKAMNVPREVLFDAEMQLPDYEHTQPQ